MAETDIDQCKSILVKKKVITQVDSTFNLINSSLSNCISNIPS